MRNYWLKIALGALGIFLVGMLGTSLFHRAKHSIEDTVNGTDPITIPTPFVDFKLDGRKLGRISRVVLLRNEPHHIAGVTVVLKVPDSLQASLKGCILSVDNVDNLNDKSSFRCGTAKDTAGKMLAPFGYVSIRGTPDSFELLLPQEAIEGIQKTTFKMNNGSFSMSDQSDSAEEVADSIREYRDSVREAIHDSLSAAADRMNDSMQSASERLADSLTEAALRKASAAPKAAPATIPPVKPVRGSTTVKPGKVAAPTPKP